MEAHKSVFDDNMYWGQVAKRRESWEKNTSGRKI